MYACGASFCACGACCVCGVYWWTGVEQGSTSLTALHAASKRGHVEVVTALVLAGAAVDARLVRVCGTSAETAV